MRSRHVLNTIDKSGKRNYTFIVIFGKVRLHAVTEVNICDFIVSQIMEICEIKAGDVFATRCIVWPYPAEPGRKEFYEISMFYTY